MFLLNLEFASDEGSFFSFRQKNIHFNPLPNEKFNTSKLKEFAGDNFKLDENGRKSSKRVENTVGKGEIARYE